MAVVGRGTVGAALVVIGGTANGAVVGRGIVGAVLAVIGGTVDGAAVMVVTGSGCHQGGRGTEDAAGAVGSAVAGDASGNVAVDPAGCNDGSVRRPDRDRDREPRGGDHCFITRVLESTPSNYAKVYNYQK